MCRQTEGWTGGTDFMAIRSDSKQCISLIKEIKTKVLEIDSHGNTTSSYISKLTVVKNGIKEKKYCGLCFDGASRGA